MKYTILLGGIGGDSHSVGLTLLRQALREKYNILYIGPQSDIEEFIRLSHMVNLVLISCMDGHAKKYLSDFKEKLNFSNNTFSKWFLGGNPSMNSDIKSKEYFLDMGFTTVFMGFVDLDVVIEQIEKNLSGMKMVPMVPRLWGRAKLKSINISGNVSDRSMADDHFMKLRTNVLESWKTGDYAKDFENNAHFLSKLKTFSSVQNEVIKGEREILVQPRSGVADKNAQLFLFKSFQKGGADVLSYQVDSLTRNNNYIDAEEAIKESSYDNSLLNGFPVINHGRDVLREIVSNINVPLQTRHSTREPELLAELSYSGGVSSYEGGAICYNIPYYKKLSLYESIRRWQYVDKLTGYYFKYYGVTLDREFFGPLTGTLIPPSIAITVCLVESILAAQQGVKSVSVGYAEQGNRIQDVAAIRALKEIHLETFSNLGFENMQVNTVFHQYMAAFPTSSKKSKELIFESALTAKLSRANRILTKSPVEASNIPSVKDNLEGLNLVRKGFLAAETVDLNEFAISKEVEIIKDEVNSIFTSILFEGNGVLASGVVNSFEKGLIEIPFSPSIYNKGNLVTARDSEGAIRFLNSGMLRLSKDAIDFNHDKMSERFRSEGLIRKNNDYKLVTKDLLQVSRGLYDRWPLN